MILLHELDQDDPLRNTPLAYLDAMCRNKHQRRWRPVFQWKIGSSTFNQLGEVWHENNEFGVFE